MKLKTILAVAALSLGCAATVQAQELDYEPYPHWFAGVQGGAQTTFTNFNNRNLITPTAGIYAGYWFKPVIGARIHASGKLWGSKANTMGGYRDADNRFYYDYKYVTSDLDLMLNLMTLFGRKDYYPVNVYLIGGIGLNVAWDNEHAYSRKDVMPFAWNKRHLNHNGRIGVQVDYNINKLLAVNLEVDGNSVSDRFNSKLDDKDDWQLTAALGLTFKFGQKRIKKAEPEPEPETVVEPVQEEPKYATRIDTTWYNETEYENSVVDGNDEWVISYELAASDANGADAQIRGVANFLKDYQEGTKVTVTSYADKGTGTAKKNMYYSKLRAQKATQTLVDAGVDASIITTNWKGDTVQPFPDNNDKNRCTIIKASGKKNVKTPKTVRKFKTQEVKYRVN